MTTNTTLIMTKMFYVFAVGRSDMFSSKPLSWQNADYIALFVSNEAKDDRGRGRVKREFSGREGLCTGRTLYQSSPVHRGKYVKGSALLSVTSGGAYGMNARGFIDVMQHCGAGSSAASTPSAANGPTGGWKKGINEVKRPVGKHCSSLSILDDSSTYGTISHKKKRKLHSQITVNVFGTRYEIGA